jgi:hypothetical protein
LRFEIVNPSEYPDWDALLLRSDDHSFFHTSAWARVLAKTYRFKPLFFMAQEDSRLVFLMPLMEVRSFVTGNRGVSLPYTDHCAPYMTKNEFLPDAVREAIAYGEHHRWKSIEWRDPGYFPENPSSWKEFYFHDVDLDRTEAALFAGLSDNNRRNIKKAVREGLTVNIEQSLESMRKFHRLNGLTRKRHGLPPQPFAFFKNVHESILSQGLGHVVSVSYENKTIAASVFFHFGASAIYKYGASEMKHQNLRANNLIMWEALKWYRARGFRTMSLGRTDAENQGLLRYKRTWGAKESVLKYYKYDLTKKALFPPEPAAGEIMNRLFARFPTAVLRLIGRLIYRHFG